MAQYQVPQFLEVEDKIFGPLTFKQFLYTAGGVGIGFIAWTFLPRVAALVVGVPILVFFISLAFLKVNNRPFIYAVESAIRYAFSKKLYIWKKQEKKPIKKEELLKKSTILDVPKMSQSKLRDLGWELDVHESLEGPAQGLPPQNETNWRDSLKF